MKRGQVTAIIIISIITIVALGAIIWGGIASLQEKVGDIEIKPQTNTSITAEKVFYDTEEKVSCVNMKRLDSPGEFTKTQIIFTMSDREVRFDLNETEIPEIGESKTQCFDLSDYSNPEKVEIYTVKEKEQGEIIPLKELNENTIIISTTQPTTTQRSHGGGGGGSSGGSSSTSSSSSTTQETTQTNITNETISNITANNETTETNLTVTCEQGYYNLNNTCILIIIEPELICKEDEALINGECSEILVPQQETYSSYTQAERATPLLIPMNIDFKYTESGIKDIVEDNNGNKYVLGYFSKEANFGSINVKTWEENHPDKVFRPDEFCISMGGMMCEPAIDTFIAKINSAGEWQWVRTIGSDPKIGYNYITYGGRRVTIAVFVFSSNLGIDSNGNVMFTTGSQQNLFFSDTTKLTGNFYTGNVDGILSTLVKISPSGEWINATRIKIPHEEGAILEEYHINYNQDSIDFVGKIKHKSKVKHYYNGNVTILELRVVEAAVGKMNLNGTFTKLLYLENKSNENSPKVEVLDFKVDSNGNIYVLSTMSNTLSKSGLNRDIEKESTIKIGNQILSLDYTPNLSSEGWITLSKTFIVKVNKDLEIQKIIEISGENFTASNIEIDNGDIYLAGRYPGTAIYSGTGNAIIQGNLLTPHPYSRGNKTGFILKISENGNSQWIKTFSNPISVSLIEGMILDKEKNIAILGSLTSIYGKSYFGNFEATSYGGVLPINNPGINSDIFMAELNSNGEWVSVKLFGDSKQEIYRNSKKVGNKIMVIGESLKDDFKPTSFVWDLSSESSSNILGNIIKSFFRK